jgi:hypothetical protein
MSKPSTTRRVDGKPETAADTRFFDLRESGYKGWIDQDGHAVTEPKSLVNPWRLPEDGIVDEVAVGIAARGERQVALTDRERLAAAALILARGGTRVDIARNLHVFGPEAARLAETVLSENSTETAASVAA